MGNGKKLLILTEAGDKIGYGHYTRCCAVKYYFESNGLQTDIYLNVTGSQVDQFKDVIIIDWLNAHELNPGNKYTHVLIDSYLADKEIFGKLKARFHKIIALDDYFRIDSGPDLIINPNVFGDKIKYKGVAFGGVHYVILRNAFRTESRKNEIKTNVENILITLGGDDFHKLIPMIVEKTFRSNTKVNLLIVAGSENYAEELRNYFAENSLIKVYGYVSEERMRDLMLIADLAISACGQTLHELAWLGVPTIGICVGDDQILNMKEYFTKGFLSMEIYWDEVDFHQKLAAVTNKLMSYNERKRKSDNAKLCSSSDGLENIFNAII